MRDDLDTVTYGTLRDIRDAAERLPTEAPIDARTYLAGQAMAGLIARVPFYAPMPPTHEITDRAVDFADALLRRLAEDKDDGR